MSTFGENEVAADRAFDDAADRAACAPESGCCWHCERETTVDTAPGGESICWPCYRQQYPEYCSGEELS